ncbi:hypothetical protein AAY473_016774 [Plecturocebus cupreus]
MSRAVGSPRFQQATSSRARSEGNPKATLPGAPGTDRPLLALGHRRKGRHSGSGLGLPPGRWLQAATRRGLGADTHTGRGRVWTARTQGDTRPVRQVKQQLSSDPETQERKPPAAPLGRHVGGPPLRGGGGEEAEELGSPLCRLNNTSPMTRCRRKKKTVKSSAPHVEINNGEQTVPRALVSPGLRL